MANNDVAGKLDKYIEAQIHGTIHLKTDVESITLYPISRGTEVEEYAKLLPFKTKWHSGFELDVETINLFPAYRGTKYVELAKKLAKNNIINPIILGDAVNSKKHDQHDIKKV